MPPGSACPRSGALKRDIALASFVEIAFALRRMDGFDALFPEPPVHSLFEAAPRERKRARRPDAS